MRGWIVGWIQAVNCWLRFIAAEFNCGLFLFGMAFDIWMIAIEQCTQFSVDIEKCTRCSMESIIDKCALFSTEIENCTRGSTEIGKPTFKHRANGTHNHGEQNTLLDTVPIGCKILTKEHTCIIYIYIFIYIYMYMYIPKFGGKGS